MIVVHHLNNSRSQRVLWLLEELGTPYEVKRYERDPKTRLAPAALKAAHPLGKSPVICDGNQVLAETGAIVEHLATAYGDGKLLPPSGPQRQRVIYWLHYAEGSAMPPLLLKLMFARMPGQVPALLRPLVRRIADKGQQDYVNPQLKLHADYWENTLIASEWFGGADFTAADIMMSFPIEAMAARLGMPDRPKVMAFLERIHARPAYRRALERGGPYELLR
jgi:glutathione S-transferase